MSETRRIFVLGFAIFAGFFGAGNLVLPPNLGLQSGSDWWQSAAGFLLSATLIPMMALLGHARLQGTMLDFGNKVSKRFSFLLCTGVYLIAVALPCPRTAAVTHEMSVAPYFQMSSLKIYARTYEWLQPTCKSTHHRSHSVQHCKPAQVVNEEGVQ